LARPSGVRREHRLPGSPPRGGDFFVTGTQKGIAEVFAGFVEVSDGVKLRGSRTAESCELGKDIPNPMAAFSAGTHLGQCGWVAGMGIRLGVMEAFEGHGGEAWEILSSFRIPLQARLRPTGISGVGSWRAIHSTKREISGRAAFAGKIVWGRGGASEEGTTGFFHHPTCPIVADGSGSLSKPNLLVHIAIAEIAAGFQLFPNVLVDPAC
jgi:hypothetical protein